MKIILPVAGKGTRLRPHTHTKAKSLVHVAGKTVLEHIISRLQPLAANEYIFITDENGGQIKDFMARTFPALHCALYRAEGAPRAGPCRLPGGAAHQRGRRCADRLQRHHLCRRPDRYRASAPIATASSIRRRSRIISGSGSMCCRAASSSTWWRSRKRRSRAWPRSGFTTSRTACVSCATSPKRSQAGETVKGEYYLPAVFMRMIGAGMRFRAPEIDAWLDCGKPETLLETNRYLLRGRHHMPWRGDQLGADRAGAHQRGGGGARQHPRPERFGGGRQHYRSRASSAIHRQRRQRGT